MKRFISVSRLVSSLLGEGEPGEKHPAAPSRPARSLPSTLTRWAAGAGPRGATPEQSPAAAAARGSRGCRAARRGAARAARGRGSSAPDAAAPGPSRRRGRLSGNRKRNRKHPSARPDATLRSNASMPRGRGGAKSGGGTRRAQRPLGSRRTVAWLSGAAAAPAGLPPCLRRSSSGFPLRE